MAQVGLTPVADAVTATLAVSEAVAVAVQKLAAVMVTVYVPVPILFSTCVVWLFDQLYEYGPKPPAGTAVSVPLFAPAQGGLTASILAVGGTAAKSVTLADAVQLLASLTVRV